MRKPNRLDKAIPVVLGLLATGLVLAGQSASGSIQGGLAPELPGGPWGIVILAVVLALLGGLFVAAEYSVRGLKSNAIRNLRERDPKRADKLQPLLDKQSDAAAAANLGHNLMRLLLVVPVFLLAPGIASVVAGWFGWNPESYAVIVGCAFGLLLLLFGPLALGFEQGFKVYGTMHPLTASYRLRGFIYTSLVLFAIPARFANAFSNVLNMRLSALAPPSATPAEEEIRTLVESAEETGEIEEDEKELIHSAFEFGDTVAREIMTPRVDLDAVSIETTPEVLAKVIMESGHSRIPLFEGTDDQIVGVIHAKDLLQAMVMGQDVDVRKLIRTALFVPENKGLHDLLTDMRVARTQLAIVQDEFGGTAGIVTIEDIVEELVGEIVDEYDVEEPELLPAGDGWSVDGKMHIDDLNHFVESEFDSEEFDTVGGFVFGHFGRQPRPMEAIEVDGFRFTVTETDGRRILRLHLERLPAVEAELA